MTKPVRLAGRDLLLMNFLAAKKGVPIDVLGPHFFSHDPRNGTPNKHPIRSCARRVSTLTQAGYLTQTDLDEPAFDGTPSRLIALSKKGAAYVGTTVRRIHARHFDHHVATLRACEERRQALVAAGAHHVDYKLEHEFMADAYAADAREKGSTFEAFPDAVLTIEGFDGGVHHVAVEYVTRAYTDEQIADKNATFGSYDDLHWVADTVRTAVRVQAITNQECDLL